MARNRGAKHAMCRRVGRPLCGSPKCPAIKRPYPSGAHGSRKRRPRLSDYGERFLEKQKLRSIYGILEKQFRRYFERAERMSGNTGENLLKLLETRLDSIVFRLKIAPTMPAARQLVGHGHILVNGKKVDIPSYQVKPGDQVTVVEKDREIPIIEESLHSGRRVPDYLKLERDKYYGSLLRDPLRDEIPIDVNATRIVEFYSR